MREKVLIPKVTAEEKSLEITLRPKTLAEFVGQEKLKEKLQIFIQAARQRHQSLEHCLFYSPPGLGKTTLAHIIANEMGVNIRVTSGPILEKVGDLAALLTNLEDRDVFFIDEIHRINRLVEEAFYPALEEFKLDIIIGQGPSARSIKLDLPQFTLVGATTRAGLLTSPLRERFGIAYHIDFYNPAEIKNIVLRSANLLAIKIDDSGAEEISQRARGTPRIANRLLRRIRDFAQVKSNGEITLRIVEQALQLLEIDNLGLDPMDRRILGTIIEKFGGGPVGIETISVAVGEEIDTITDVYESYLIQSGLLARTPRGRVATPTAYKHLGLSPTGEQLKLVE